MGATPAAKVPLVLFAEWGEELRKGCEASESPFPAFGWRCGGVKVNRACLCSAPNP